MTGRQSEARLLAIDATSRGFGFVVFDRSRTLIDWGTAHARASDRHERLAMRLRALLKRYAPSVLVVEDASDPSCRRSTQVRRFLSRAAALASEEGVRVCPLDIRAVRKSFAPFGARTKHEIASAITVRYPELAPRLPPKRKPWMSEDERMSIFDAAALMVSYLDRGRRTVG